MTIVEKAPAKLNLSLGVGPRRADGFHDIDSVMVPLRLADELTLTSADRFSLSVRGPTAGLTPPGPDNLVWRAANALAQRANLTPSRRGASIVLHKNIPVGGGLGGGSSDAAAALRGLNRLWGLNLPPDELLALAAELGSDVPFCVIGRAARVGGRGQLVTPLTAALPPLWAALIFPGLHVSTADVYRRLDDLRARDGLPATSQMNLAGIPLYNDLEVAALDVCPALAAVFEQARRAGLDRLMVAGSGSTLFALFDDPSQADQWEQRLSPHLQCPVVVTAVADG